MSHPYRDVPPYTNIFVAEQRDVICWHEMAEALEADEAEPMTHRAWRSILDGHSNIRYQIGKLRWALYAQGLPLSRRGMAYIEDCLTRGMNWADARPHISMITAQKNLLACIGDMPRRWVRLREMETQNCG